MINRCFYLPLDKPCHFVYNGQGQFPENRNQYDRIIPISSNFSIDGIDDSHKTTTYNLVEFTMKFAFYTLGCKTNQYETQAMERLLLEMGHEIGSFDEACDGYEIGRAHV